jgi:hypothetical protein
VWGHQAGMGAGCVRRGQAAEGTGITYASAAHLLPLLGGQTAEPSAERVPLRRGGFGGALLLRDPVPRAVIHAQEVDQVVHRLVGGLRRHDSATGSAAAAATAAPWPAAGCAVGSRRLRRGPRRANCAARAGR